MDKTVIISSRRRRSDYREGYAERNASEAGEWVDYFRSIGSVVKVFPSINEYRDDCNRLLNKLETERKAQPVK